MLSYQKPDLTQHPPRSPRVRLGGFVHLPRLLDKARAHAAGKLGEYVWNCPLDQRWTAFAGVEIEALLVAVKSGKNDADMLAWVTENGKPSRALWEIEAWSNWMSNLAPGDIGRHTVFAEMLAKANPKRDDVRTFFDRLDFDDYTSYGGQA